MNSDITLFRQNMAELFAAATGLEKNNAGEVLFEGKSFNSFDELLENGKLELVRTQTQFFETCLAAGEVDDETKELLMQMTDEAKKTIFDYAVACLAQKKISGDEFANRTRLFIKSVSSEDFKAQVLKKAENILGCEIYVELK